MKKGGLIRNFHAALSASLSDLSYGRETLLA